MRSMSCFFAPIVGGTTNAPIVGVSHLEAIAPPPEGPADEPGEELPFRFTFGGVSQFLNTSDVCWFMNL